MTMGADTNWPLPPGRERKLLVRRCIAEWVNVAGVTRAEWDRRFSRDIRSEAKHRMGIEQLRLRE